MSAEAEWKEAFDKFDIDGKGTISAQELVTVMEVVLGDPEKAATEAQVSTLGTTLT